MQKCLSTDGRCDNTNTACQAPMVYMLAILSVKVHSIFKEVIGFAETQGHEVISQECPERE